MALKDEYFTISEAAKEIKVTRQTISRWAKDGILPTEKVGSAVLIKKDALYQHNEKRLFEEKRISYEGQLINFIREKYNYTEDARIEFIRLNFDSLFVNIMEGRDVPEEEKCKKIWDFIVTLKNGTQEKVWVKTGKAEHLIRKQGEPFVYIGMREPIEWIGKETLKQQ